MKLALMLGLVALTLAAGCGDDVSGSGAGAGGAGAGTGTGTGTGPSGGGGTTSTGGAGGEGAGTSINCFEDHSYPIAPDYDQYAPTYGTHCAGTNHQDIEGVERLVFLGDSITQGTPPTPAGDFYRTRLADAMTAKFPGLQVDECAVNGAKVDDLMAGGDMQIQSCFPAPEPLKTLVVITIGGNDITDWPSGDFSQAEAEADAEVIAQTFHEAVTWLKDPVNFPNGSYVVFAGVYEFTDGTGDLDSCPTAGLIGLSGEYFEGALALSKLNELYMQTAVETGSDMIFLLSDFCGHGYNKDDPDNFCYVGPDAEQWFDITCIHPTPAGHGRMAEMFELTIEE